MSITDPADWEKLKDLFSDALSRPPAERAAYIREQCPDAAFRAELEDMLRAYEEHSSFLEHPSDLPPNTDADEFEDLAPGTRVGPYVILGRLGRGGMGQVFLGTDSRLHRKVALKCLISSGLEGEERRRRVLREARAAAGISHTNVATIHDVVEDKGRAFIVMEYVEGETLAARLKRERLPIDTVIGIGRQLAAALAAAHATGVVHRDLKPANVQLLPDGSVKVLDFGVAKAMALASSWSTTARLTTMPAGRRDVLVGTLGYMSPEQLLGREVDDRSDVFGLGVVLYEMTTGRRPFSKSDPMEQVVAIAKGAPRADAGDPRVPAALADLIAKALEIDPADRFQSARDMGSALETVSNELRAKPAAEAQTPAAPVEDDRSKAAADAQAAPPRRRRRLAAVAAGALFAAAVAIGLLPRRQPEVFHPRGRLVIADLQNRTGDVDLGQAIREGLTIQLQQSPFVNVLSRAQVYEALGRMQRSEVAILDDATALELCLRENVPVLVSGTIVRSADAVVVTIRGVAPSTGNLLFAESVRFNHSEEALAQVDSLARRVRERLGESMAGIDRNSQPLAQVTTGSLDALKLYSRAANEYARGNRDAAAPLLEQALDLDPRFAMAHRMLARVFEDLGNPEQERAHLDLAYQLRASLSERERRQVEASYLSARGEYEKAAAILAALTSMYPDDADARYELAVAYLDTGNLPKAAQELEATIAINPAVSGAYVSLVFVLTRLGEYDRAEEILRRARSQNIESPRLIWGAGLVSLGENKIEAARAQFRELEQAGDVYAGFARLFLASAEIVEGRLGAAIETLKNGIVLDRKIRTVRLERKRRYFLSRIYLHRQNAAEARRQVDAILSAGLDALEAEELTFMGMLLASTGQLQTSRQVLQELDQRRNATASAFIRSCYLNVRGEIALAEGDDQSAEESFTAAANEFRRAVSTIALARTYTMRRDWRRAAAEWEKVTRARGEILYEGFAADWILAHLEAARSARNAGDAAAARRHYEAFLTIWNRADDLPIRREAIEEARALGLR